MGGWQRWEQGVSMPELVVPRGGAFQYRVAVFEAGLLLGEKESRRGDVPGGK